MSKPGFFQKLLAGTEVRWKPLSQVAEIKRGTSITKKDIEPGSVPVIAGGRGPAYYHNQSNRTGQTIVIAGSGAYAGFVSWWEKPIFVSDAFSVKTFPGLLPRYCFHWLQSLQTRIHALKSGGGVPHVYPRDIAPLEIPIPCPADPQKSLTIQEEIVRILDTFTELNTELAAELAARRIQYNHYRDKLLDYAVEVMEMKPLGWIGEVRMCKRVLKHQTSATGDIPFFKIGTFGNQPDAFIPRALFEHFREKYHYPNIGDVMISASGTLGRTIIFDGRESYFQDSNIVWLENDETKVLDKYLFYFYQIAKWYVSDGGVIKRLYNDNIKRTVLPVPYPNDPKRSLAEQARIVAILDKFDTIATSLSDGLPREIALRRQQYEYYRDLLLSFPNPDEAAEA